MKNPLFDEWRKIHRTQPYPDDARLYVDAMTAEYRARENLRDKYAYAVPNARAIKRIAMFSPIVEMGAGTGYWALLLKQAGAVVDAFDNGSYKPKVRHYFVQAGDAKILTKAKYADYALFLCWPPYATRMAYQCLKQYTGNRLLYVGESQGGCTGCDWFHALLRREWECTDTIGIPQWSGLHDYLSIYNRKNSPRV